MMHGTDLDVNPRSPDDRMRVPDAPMQVWTIGHSTRSIEEFIETLKGHRIELVADVRRYPGSRRFPQFNEGPFRDALRSAGIEYRHFPNLGGRRHEVRPDSRNTAWRTKGFQAYADYMETHEFADAVENLLALAREKRTVILCAESLWWRCHRQLIADYLKVRGHMVIHVMWEGDDQEHPYSPPARIREGQLRYEKHDEKEEGDRGGKRG